MYASVFPTGSWDSSSSEDDPKTPWALRPAYGHSKDGRDDLKQVLLSLGVSGNGGLPLRIGVRGGNRNDSTEMPEASEECLALGLAGMRGGVADSKDDSRRTLELCLEHQIGLITLVPRTCAIRQELEAWGQQPPGCLYSARSRGWTKAEAPRHWHGQSVYPLMVETSRGTPQGWGGGLRPCTIFAMRRLITRILTPTQARTNTTVSPVTMRWLFQ